MALGSLGKSLVGARHWRCRGNAAGKLGEYRKMNPTPLEEWLFFDHPSGRVRIYTAMRWKAEN
jgi:hypothetical protein